MSTGATVRVLLVDDDEDEFVLTRDWLAEIDEAGFDVDWVADYETARQTMAARTHDVYLVDYRLGAHSGLELLQGWPADTPEFPVVVLTGVGNRDVDLEAMRLGATSYLTKTEINGRVLERTIRYTLEIHRARLAQRNAARRLRQYGEQQSLLAALGRSIIVAMDVGEIVHEAVRLATDGLRAEGGAFLEWQPTTTQLTVRAGYGSLAATSGATLATLDTWPALALREAAPLPWTPAHATAPAFEPYPLSGALCVAVRGPARTLGVLVVVRASAETEYASDCAFFEATAQMLAQTIERSHAVAEQERLQERLRRSEVMSAMGSLVAGVAHETRNPLFGIMATVDAFASRFGGREDMTQYLGVLKKEVGRLNALMTDLIEYGRPRPPELVETSFASVVKDAVGGCEILAAQAEVEVVIDIAPEVPSFDMDAHRLTHALQNVIQNAIQHAPRGTTVHIDAVASSANADRAVCCRIRDGGEGFDAADLPHVFEPFFTRRNGGTGLGLAIVQRVVEEHGGVITAANAPEGGGVVVIDLPLAPPRS